MWDKRKEIVVKFKRKEIVNVGEYIGGLAMKFKYEYVDVKESRSNLIGDHIKPIALGGEEFDPDNIQTLCIKCNKVKTSQDAKDIAIQRHREKQLKT